MTQKCTDSNCNTTLIFNEENSIFICPVDGTQVNATSLSILLHAIEIKSATILNFILYDVDNADFKDVKEVNDEELNMIFNNFGWEWCDYHGYKKSESECCHECQVRACEGCRGGWPSYDLCNTCGYDY